VISMVHVLQALARVLTPAGALWLVPDGVAQCED
jgi:hypothetical protein